MSPSSAPASIRALVDRFDPEVFPIAGHHARIRLQGSGAGRWDVLLHDGRVELEAADEGARPDAVIDADGETWAELADGLGGGMAAFRAGRLAVRHDLHLGVGFLAATSGDRGPAGLRFAHVETAAGRLSTMQAGAGPPVVLVHGLGATKASFLPTIAALAPHHRAIALDLPGFGDSDKPIGATYDAAFFARAVVALLDALELRSAAIVGNSMGGRVAIEVGLSHPGRASRLVLLAPSLAWLRDRPLAGVLRLLPPEIGLLQPTPRALVEALARRAIPGGGEGWTAAGVDEFLRSYLEPRGRAAFYAAARNIYLEEPHGEDGFWTRLATLSVPSLFIWGRRDPVVPHAFARHVRTTLPAAHHLELDCGHVPQLERPQVTHDAILRFLDAEAAAA